MRHHRAPIAVFGLLLSLVVPARGQVQGPTTPMEKFKAMSGDLEALEGKAKDKEKQKPPFEFYKSQIAPFNLLPYVKRNHWSTLLIDMQSNLGDYEGQLQTSAEVNGRSQIKLLDMPHAMIFRREVRMPKGQRMKLGMHLFLPDFRKELLVELTRPDAIRSDFGFTPQLQRLETPQMLIPILAPVPDPYTLWNRMQATIPTSGDRADGNQMEVERQRYYRLVLPQSEKPALSTNPLTWTSTSHIVWDGLDPSSLNTEQRGAMLDWLYWGGQVVVVAAGPSLGTLEEGFLGRFLPATSAGKNASLGAADLAVLSSRYLQPIFPSAEDPTIEIPGIQQPGRVIPPRYGPVNPISPIEGRPLFVAGLEPKPGATAIPLGDPGGHHLAVEWRVGRGRLTMLAVNPNDPALAKWTGMDSLVRRVLLRRVEEGKSDGSKDRRIYNFLSGPELTWVRFLSRDLGASPAPQSEDETDPNSPIREEPVGAWLDTRSTLPVMARKSLELASGITIPGSKFVLKVILIYLFTLVPLNWLVCRFVIRRRELAWVAVPVLALGFAITVERAAAYDMGFDSDCTEINLLELQGDYPRGHLTRFAALYSTGRDRYSITYPNDPSALALPLNAEHALRGEESALSAFQSTPDPALTAFQVQPRSLSMFRAEAMVNLPGGITLSGDIATGKLENSTGLELHDAVLIDTATNARKPLGTIAAGATVVLGSPRTPVNAAKVDWTDLKPYLDELSNYSFGRPEDRGEIRLVAWAANPHPGQVLAPKVDRNRGFRLVVAHLRYGPPPDPGGPAYVTPAPTGSKPVADSRAPQIRHGIGATY